MRSWNTSWRALGALLLGLCGASAGAQVVQATWEDGTTQGWTPFGNVTLTNSAAAARSGSRSLLTTGRTATFNGPALNLTGKLVPDATYQISAWVRLPAGTPATQVRLSMQRTAGGSTSYDSVAASAAAGVTDGGWTQITGLYAFAEPAPSSLVLYVESASATAPYHLDDVTVSLVSGPPGLPPNTSGLSSNFEAGTQGWFGRGATVATTTESAHGGSQALLATGRAGSWAGPAYDVTSVMFNGSTYRISAWVKLPASAGSATAQARISLQRDAGSLTTYHTVVNSTTVGSGAWVRLQGTYPVALANTRLTLYVETGDTQPLLLDDVQISYVAPPSIEPGLPSLAQSQAAWFPVGTIGYTGGLSGVQGDLVTKHFNSLVAENEMKWSALQAQPGVFTWANADAQVAFAKARGMKLRGHTLVWHEQVPAWVFQDASGQPLTPSPAAKALVLQREVEHITAVLNHFAPHVGSFYAWDVANEVIDPAQPDCMRRSSWYLLTGTDFIDTAFRTARALLPAHVKLYYNDYSTTDVPKLACLHKLVAGMRARGVPIDGIGHQMHISLGYPTPVVVGHMVRSLASAFPGISQQVTEMDIKISDNGPFYATYEDIPPAVHAQLGYAWRNYFNTFRQLGGLIDSVTIWGQADNHTWLSSGSRAEAPLLFDTALKAKPAYWGIVDPSRLPGAALSGSITAKAGAQNARVWTLAFSNAGPGTAHGVRLAGLSLRQTGGAACTPVVRTAFPVPLGDIAAGASASTGVSIDFTGCPALATFAVDAPFHAANGWHGDPAKGSPALTLSRTNQFR
jgi:endo-1,4-beta-xylanase